jgi:hypothetical protein
MSIKTTLGALSLVMAGAAAHADEVKPTDLSSPEKINLEETKVPQYLDDPERQKACDTVEKAIENGEQPNVFTVMRCSTLGF